MKTAKPTRLILAITIAFMGGYILLLLTVPFLGVGWHLIHGNFIESSGCRIPVPKQFYVSANAEQPTMWKHTLGIPLLKRPFGMIGIRPRSPATSFEFANDFDNSSKRMIAVARQEGLTLRSNRLISTGAGNAYCFEFSNTDARSEVTVRCALDDTPLLMIYGGDERFSADFYLSVKGVSRLTK